MGFKDLKKRKNELLQQMMEEIDKNSSEGNKQGDDRFWKLTRDKQGNGSALIRFLPPVGDETIPWVRIFSHSFQGPTGRWYIEKSLTTLGQDDPVSDYNSELWATGEESKRNIARKQKRKLRYISNILVIKDPANEENNGKVFLFEYGKKIFDKINEVMYPEKDPLSDEEPESMNPFDFWEGADFKLIAKIKDKFVNYDSSTFCDSSALFDGDDKLLEELYETKIYPLQPLIAPSEFKTYDDLKKRFDGVIGGAKPATKVSSVVDEDVDNEVSQIEEQIGEDSSDENSEELAELLALANAED